MNKMATLYSANLSVFRAFKIVVAFCVINTTRHCFYFPITASIEVDPPRNYASGIFDLHLTPACHQLRRCTKEGAEPPLTSDAADRRFTYELTVFIRPFVKA